MIFTRPFLLLALLVVLALPACSQAVPSKVYAWRQASVTKYTGYEVRTLLKGITRDFSDLTLQIITLQANHPIQHAQQLDEEVVLVVKTGELTLTIGEKPKALGPGSVALIMPGDLYRLENKSAQPLTYYLIRYTSNEMPDLDLYRLAGGSFWVDWKDAVDTPLDKGNDRHMPPYMTIMSKRLGMHLTTLEPGGQSRLPSNHRAAELLIMLENTAQARLEGGPQKVEEGDVLFIESNVAYSIENARQDKCAYLTLQFE